jgi:tetratricopeptide (TPR) repeat protein
MTSSLPAVIGRYSVIQSLGQGGMGAVYLARDPAIDRLVAVKLMRGEAPTGELRERFLREARAIGRLQHPNIVTIYEFGEHEGEPFIAMEYIEGYTVAQLVGRRDVSLEMKLQIFDGACAGLQYAHRAGIVHRDVKPANIMISHDDAVKLLDFGIARGPAFGKTQTGAILGTLNYMSPEQLLGKGIDHRTDIFSSGAVFYELLSGEPAFPGDIQTGLLNLLLTEGPQPLARLVPDLPADICRIVDRCLARDPQERYADMVSVRRDLAATRRRLDQARANAGTAPIVIPAEVLAAPPPPTPPPSPETAAEIDRLRRERVEIGLNAARQALERGDHAAALDACHQVLVIDHLHTGALELRRQVDAAIQAQHLLRQAREHIERGALTSASELVDRAEALGPRGSALADVREAIATERRRIKAEAERADRMRDARARARAELDAGRLDAAADAIAALTLLAPDSDEVTRLGEELTTLREAHRRVAEQEEAERVAAEARSRFYAGDHRGALTILRKHKPAHELIDREIAWVERMVRELRSETRRGKLQALLASLGAGPGRPPIIRRAVPSWALLVIGVTVVAGVGITVYVGRDTTPEPPPTATPEPPPPQAPTPQPTAEAPTTPLTSSASPERPPADPPDQPAATKPGDEDRPPSSPTTVTTGRGDASTAGRGRPANQSAIDAAALVQSGDQLRQDQRFAEALRDYLKAVALDPANTAAQEGRDKAREGMKLDAELKVKRADQIFASSTGYCDNEQALQLVRQALTLDADNAAARTLLQRVQGMQQILTDGFRSRGESLPRCSGGGA